MANSEIDSVRGQLNEIMPRVRRMYTIGDRVPEEVPQVFTGFHATRYWLVLDQVLRLGGVDPQANVVISDLLASLRAITG